jgi:uncharacterized membrane protein SirB2
MTCAGLSIAGFTLRSYWVLSESTVMVRKSVRYVPITIDSLLLATALLLATWSGQWPLQQGWLSAKLVALLVYIGLGMIALHWGRNRTQRLAAMAGAICVFGYIVAVAMQRTALPFM